MQKLTGIGQIGKNFSSIVLENGTKEYSIPVIIKEIFKKLTGENDVRVTNVTLKLWRKTENIAEFENNLKAGASVYFELEMAVAYCTVKENNEAFGFFGGNRVRQFLFLGANSENFIKLIVIGNVTADAVVKDLTHDTTRKAINYCVAVNDKSKDKEGNVVEKAIFVNCGMFKLAENTSLANWIKKGGKIAVEGRPIVRVGAGDNGEMRAYFNAEIYNLEFVGGSKSTDPAQAAEPAFSELAPVEANGGYPSNGAADDLPFLI